MTTSQDLGIILQCIGGEEWPATSFSSFLDLKVDSVSETTITFSCPLGHSFTLAQAIKKGIFTKEVAQRLLLIAQERFKKGRAEYEERTREGWRARPSDYIPNEEVVKAGWLCKKCGSKAQWAPGSPKEEERALCLQCRADRDNFWTDHRGAREVFEGSKTRPYWRPRELLDKELWRRFLRGAPPITESGAKKLLAQFQEKAKQEVRGRAQLRRRAKKNGLGTPS
ncbi:MAG: hypothetical protein HYS52_01080 [Candidatus Wildermuthbacteria bacterium]|nr:hypothetical protein [Candidatus Wildermuthbacteria bacterium]